mmetsp:Transcript_15923/g.35869  ORF Transcript_15923/g.35869 Transcript_15923/m.35869 type:complete len:154 (-) Transcript_15923:204-665(-)
MNSNENTPESTNFPEDENDVPLREAPADVGLKDEDNEHQNLDRTDISPQNREIENNSSHLPALSEKDKIKEVQLTQHEDIKKIRAECLSMIETIRTLSSIDDDLAREIIVLSNEAVSCGYTGYETKRRRKLIPVASSGQKKRSGGEGTVGGEG